LVNTDQLAEANAFVLRHRLYTPCVLRGALGLRALWRAKHRIRDFALQGVVGISDSTFPFAGYSHS
jgi:hypothetical protein